MSWEFQNNLEMRMATRNSFHGDEVEGELGQYYCAFCDFFVEEKHFFEVSHSSRFTDKERYEQSVKNVPGDIHRPCNASNLFSSIPKTKKTRTSPFYRWLLKQKDRDDPIGDVSRDAQRDKYFPLETTSLKKIRSHLINKLACEEAIKTLEEAHEEFKNNKTVRSGI